VLVREYQSKTPDVQPNKMTDATNERRSRSRVQIVSAREYIIYYRRHSRKETSKTPDVQPNKMTDATNEQQRKDIMTRIRSRPRERSVSAREYNNYYLLTPAYVAERKRARHHLLLTYSPKQMTDDNKKEKIRSRPRLLSVSVLVITAGIAKRKRAKHPMYSPTND